jgi:hypothetical protein
MWPPEKAPRFLLADAGIACRHDIGSKPVLRADRLPMPGITDPQQRRRAAGLRRSDTLQKSCAGRGAPVSHPQPSHAIFEVFIANAATTAAMVVFEIPTGAVEAWLVDALKATGYQGQLDRVFAHGSMVSGAAIQVGVGGWWPARRHRPGLAVPGQGSAPHHGVRGRPGGDARHGVRDRWPDHGVGRRHGPPAGSQRAMIALLLALASSASYGASDFLASRVAKRLAPVLLVLYSQAAQGFVLLVIVLALRQPVPATGLGWGAVAGALIAIGLVAYYQALAIGPTAVVARWRPAAPSSRCWSTLPGANTRAGPRWSECSSSVPASP